MSDFGACALCGAPAIEQIRGKLGPADKGYVAAVDSKHPDQWSSNNPVNAPDTRVTCSQCDNATGWNKPEFADYTRFLWNRDHADHTRQAARVRSDNRPSDADMRRG